MKLQPESKKELTRIACGTAICTAVMWVIFAALHLVGWVKFDYTVVLGSLIGAAVAIGNFAGICIVCQKVIDEQDEKRQQEWRKVYDYILKKVTYLYGGKQLLLKSPENTCRIGALKKCYPGAKFINIYRNPYTVVMSTINMFTKEMGLFCLNEPASHQVIEDVTIDLFERMKNGEFPEGSRVLRAKIDMASPNINMRDPTIYRIKYCTHHRTGDKWCIYPMYDFAHPIGDALEGVTHSLCSLEYEIHRPLYDWVVNVCNFKEKPRQIEFARLNLTNTVMSKRFLRRLVEEGYVSGWDDPRMPTLAGMRRRGYTSAAVRDFIDRVGVSKADSVVDVRLLEYCVRNDLNETAPRAMAVLDPVKVVLTNYEAGKVEDCVIENHPKKPEMGTHTVPLTREIYIEREDFMVDAPKKFFRLKPDGEVRLKGAYIIKCERYDVDEAGNVTCIYCSVDFTSKSGSEGADRKVKGTIHWVSAERNIPFEGRLYDVLMRDDDEQAEIAPEEETDEESAAPAKDFTARLNPDSLKTIRGFAEPWLAEAKVGDDFQFLRMGYFCKDKDSTADMAVFNRVVPLKDSYKPE